MAQEMSDDQFVALIEELSGQCYGASVNGQLQVDRAAAISRYNTELWGDEVDGRSKLVSSVVRDTVEEAIPQLLRIFLGGDEVVQFDPVGPEDENQSKQETQYINHVITQKNPAFQIFSTWFRDALLCKNGYVMARWEERDDIRVEQYRGLPDDAYALLTSDPSVQVIMESAYPDPSGMFPQVHDVNIRRAVKKGQVRVDNVPPEEIRVHVTTRGVNLNDGDCIYAEHRRLLTLSEIRQMGYDIPDDWAGSDYDQLNNEEVIARNRFSEQPWVDEMESSDPSTRRAMFRHAYIRADRDGDGIAELRKVCLVNAKIVHEEEAELIPIACITPVIQPHRHIGYGYYDFLREIESAATAMLRAFFDNVYLANNGRYGVNVNQVNIDDMLVSKPGGLVRVDGMPGEAIFPLNHSSNGDTALNALQFLENWKKQSTGVMSDAQSLSSDVLSKAPMGSIAQVISVWQARVEGVARAFSETGVKELFRIVHALILQNATAPERAKINGEWVAVDPREWVKRENLTVSVGLGTGSKESKVQFLQQLGMAQAQAIPLGIATPKNVYESAMELVKEMGYKDGSRFWTDPTKNPPQPQQPPPEVQAAQAQSQALIQKAQIDAQSKIQAEQAKLALEPQKMAQEAQIRAQETEHKTALEIYKINKQAEVDIAKEQIKAQYTVQAARASKPGLAEDEAAATDSKLNEFANQVMDAVKEEFKNLHSKVDGSKVKSLRRGSDGKVSHIEFSDGRISQVMRSPDGKVMGIE